MKIGLCKKEKRLDLGIKHIQLIIDGKEYYISFSYSLRNGIKDVRVYGEPAVVIDAYPAFPKVVKICACFILANLRIIMHKFVRKLKGHNQLNGHK